MPVKEKNPQNEKDAQAPVMPAGWLDRLDEFGQKHARIILTIAAGLIVLTVLIIANTAYKRSIADRVARDVSKAKTADALKELKDRYIGTPELALVVAALGNKLYEDGRLADAKKELDEFMEKFSDHPLSLSVQKVQRSLAENMRFESEQKDALLAVPSLETHPIKTAKLRHDIARLQAELETLKKNPERKAEAEAVEREIERRLASPLGIGPIKLPHPVLQFTIKDKEAKPKGTFRVELFEDEAPNTVAALVELVEKKYFDGHIFTLVGTDERLQVPAKKDNAIDYVIPFEPTVREGLSGSFVMVRQGANNLPAEFQLLLKSIDAPGDVTICGVVLDVDNARKVTADDIIDSVTVEKKRSHEYKPATVKP